MNKQGGIKDISVGRSDVYRLKPEDIHIRDGWNARDFSNPENIAHVEQIAASIEAVGISKLPPLRVIWEDGKAFLTDGESRLRAIRLAISRGHDVRSVQVMTEDRSASEADQVFTMVAANSGKQLTPLEMGSVFKRLTDFGWSEKDIALKAGLSTQRVRDLLQLHAAPTEIKDMVKAGAVTPTLAQQVIRQEKGDTKAATTALTDAVKTAKAAGKKKATAKHVAKLTPKKEIAEIFRTLMPMPGGFMISEESMKRLRKLLKIKAA